MPFGQKPANQISEADLLALIEAKTSEGKEIDYKKELPGPSDRDRREYLYDVSSFANTLGGYLIFGMDEAAGVATEIPGLAGINPDNEIRRLEEMARDGIRPPITGIEDGAGPTRIRAARHRDAHPKELEIPLIRSHCRKCFGFMPETRMAMPAGCGRVEKCLCEIRSYWPKDGTISD